MKHDTQAKNSTKTIPVTNIKKVKNSDVSDSKIDQQYEKIHIHEKPYKCETCDKNK